MKQTHTLNQDNLARKKICSNKRNKNCNVNSQTTNETKMQQELVENFTTFYAIVKSFQIDNRLKSW